MHWPPNVAAVTDSLALFQNPEQPFKTCII